MVELTYPMLLDTIRTIGILVGIFYYISIIRNTEKNRMKEMVFRRMQTQTPEYFKCIYDANPSLLEWETVEEFHQKYNWKTTPDLMAKRNYIFRKLNAWGFLLKEGLIELNFIPRLLNPAFIKYWWEINEPIFIDNRKRTGNTEFQKDFEYLYDAVKKMYPNIKYDTVYHPEYKESIIDN